MASFDKSTPFMLLARMHVNLGCVDQYLELARFTDEAVQATEPRMIHHTFDQAQTIPWLLCGPRFTPTMRRLAPTSLTHLFRSTCRNMLSLEMASALRSTALLVMSVGN